MGPGAFRRSYLAYFLYLGTFGPFWTTYCKQVLGFDEHFVGTLSLVLVLSTLITSFFVARISDAFRWRRRIQRTTSALGVLTSIGFGYIQEPWQALVLIVLHAACAHTQVPLLDATTIDYLGKERHRFARFRLVGTLGWGLGALALGPLRQESPEFLVPLMATFLGLFHASTWFLPDTQIAVAHGHPRLQIREALKQPAMAWLILTSFLHSLSSAPYEIFGAPYFDAAGLTPIQVSLLYALGIVCEIGVFLVAPNLLLRVAPVKFVILGMGLASLRWWLTAHAPNGATLFAIQPLHALTFGLWYVSALHLLSRLTRPELRTSGQTLFSLTYSLGMGIGGKAAAELRTSVGPSATFEVASGLSALCLVLGLLAYRHLSHPEPARAH